MWECHGILSWKALKKCRNGIHKQTFKCQVLKKSLLHLLTVFCSIDQVADSLEVLVEHFTTKLTVK